MNIFGGLLPLAPPVDSEAPCNCAGFSKTSVAVRFAVLDLLGIKQTEPWQAARGKGSPVHARG